MRRTMCWVALVVLTAVAAGLTLFSQNRDAAAELLMPAGASYHIALGVDDREASSWDGSIAVSAGAIASIEGVRFAAGDSTDSKSSWKASTHRAPTIPNQPGPLVPNGVIVTTTTDDPAATFNVKTAQGNFSFSARDIAWDQGKTFLAGRVRVERAPNLARLTTSSEDQDYPAIAQTDDAVYVAYVEFKHANPDMEGNRPLTAEPKGFDYLARPAGGDQVMLMRYTKASKKWSSGMPVSAPNQDVVRTSVAVDGQKRVWVFWSARQNGNYDIYAKNLAGGKWSNEVRITSDPGTDLNPVAATDSKGRVWVAWQGYRNNNLEILTAAQNGDAFSPETILSFSKASDWDPAIATSSNGEVAVAWDTYDKGDYDVYFRRLHMTGSIKMDPPVPVAAGKGFEARASATYDAQNRLWIAYEASANQWGKDWGAYETSGVALYQDHTVKVKCFQGNQVLAPQGDLAKALPAALLYNAAGQMSGSESRDMTFPNSEIVKTRQFNQDPAPPPLPKNSFPKIASDPAGAIYLTFRTPMQGRTGLGTVWETRVAYLDGNTWKPSIPVPDTDYWLDVRAAMTAVGPGDLLLVSVQDHRLAISRPPAAAGAVTKKKMAGQKKAMNKGALAAAAFNPALNADLVAAEFRFGSLHQATTKPAAPEQVSAPDAVTAPERQQIKMMRDYRAKAGSDKLQIMRGEFHRHTEISTDGGNDGPIIDAYRYMIDAGMMDWGVCCDHDNGNGREYTWWIAQKLTDAYHIPGTYTPMFGYERSVQYPEGHRNAVIPIRGVRPLPRLPIMDADSAIVVDLSGARQGYRYVLVCDRDS